MNVVLAMGSLRLRQPGPSAPASEVAAWYQAKGRLHEQVAAEGGDDAKQEAAYAAAAYEHARRLLGEAPELAGVGA